MTSGILGDDNQWLPTDSDIKKEINNFDMKVDLISSLKEYKK